MPFSGFSVTGNREVGRITPGGQRQTDVIISITTDLGASGSLTLPKAVYEAMTDEELAQVILDKANSLDRVFRL
jgi:hypothetical protein